MPPFPTMKPGSYQTDTTPNTNAQCAGEGCPFYGKCGPKAAQTLRDVTGQTGGFGGETPPKTACTARNNTIQPV